MINLYKTEANKILIILFISLLIYIGRFFDTIKQLKVISLKFKIILLMKNNYL